MQPLWNHISLDILVAELYLAERPAVQGKLPDSHACKPVARSPQGQWTWPKAVHVRNHRARESLLKFLLLWYR